MSVFTLAGWFVILLALGLLPFAAPVIMLFVG